MLILQHFGALTLIIIIIIIQPEFALTWSCVSFTRSTTSSKWKLFTYDKTEVNCFQILLIAVTF